MYSLLLCVGEDHRRRVSAGIGGRAWEKQQRPLRQLPTCLSASMMFVWLLILVATMKASGVHECVGLLGGDGFVRMGGMVSV